MSLKVNAQVFYQAWGTADAEHRRSLHTLAQVETRTDRTHWIGSCGKRAGVHRCRSIIPSALGRIINVIVGRGGRQKRWRPEPCFRPGQYASTQIYFDPFGQRAQYLYHPSNLTNYAHPPEIIRCTRRIVIVTRLCLITIVGIGGWSNGDG